MARLSSGGDAEAWSFARPYEDANPSSAVVMALGIGFVGSGFNARFHIQAFTGVRDAEVRGVWSPNGKHAADTARLARDNEVGDAKAYESITDMVADQAI